MDKENLKVIDISDEGHGIAYDQNNIVYVLGTFPGDIVDVNIYKKIKDISYGKIISFKEFSKDRVNSPVDEPFFDANAPWKYLSQDVEDSYKRQFVKNLYKKNSEKREINLSPAKEKLGYRNKVAYTFLDTKKGLRFALYTRGSGETKKVEQHENILAHPLIEKTGKQFLHFFNQKKIKAKQLKYLILRYSFYENKIVAYLLLPETNRKKLPFKKRDLKEFINNIKHTKGILVSNSPAGVRSALSEKDFYTIGDIEIKEKMLNKIYTYKPSLFFQINPISFVEILQDIRKYINLHVKNCKELHALDLFAGIGIIGIELADLFKTTTGIELSSLSKKYALKNAKKNDIKNFNFIETSVDKALEYIKKEQILIIDPPRRGLSKKTLKRIAEIKPEYIFYISCSPKTQHRDFSTIRKIYSIEYIKAYNLFPKTHHIESLVILKRNIKNSD